MECSAERCPRCGCVDNLVVDSRPTPAGRRRRRRCPHCNVSWSTVEVSADLAAEAAGLRQRVRVAIASLRAVEELLP